MPAAKSYEVIWGFTEMDRNGNPKHYHIGDTYSGANADTYLTSGDVNHGPLIREKAVAAATSEPKEK